MKAMILLIGHLTLTTMLLPSGLSKVYFDKSSTKTSFVGLSSVYPASKPTYIGRIERFKHIHVDLIKLPLSQF